MSITARVSTIVVALAALLAVALGASLLIPDVGADAGARMLHPAGSAAF